MNRTRSFAVASTAVLCLAAGEAPPPEVTAFVSDFVAFYQSGEFAEAAKLFHCPPSYTRAQVAADRKAVEASLRIMSGLYGPVRTVSESSGSVYVAPTTACGTAEYWKAKRTSLIRILNTEQRESEQGYLVFEFSTLGGKPVLFQFGHGLPAIHPEARSRAQSFLQRKLAE